MCKRRAAIAEQTEAARALAKACTARRTYVELRADLLRAPAPLKFLPEQPHDFDALLDQIDRKESRRDRH